MNSLMDYDVEGISLRNGLSSSIVMNGGYGESLEKSALK